MYKKKCSQLYYCNLYIYKFFYREILLKTNLPVTFDDSDNELADTDHKR